MPDNQCRIVIVGAGGFGREVFRILDGSRYLPVGFLDPCPAPDLPLPCLGDDSALASLKAREIAECVCIALGKPEMRARIYDLAMRAGLDVPSVVHRSAVIMTCREIAPGAIIYPGAVVMDNCRIGVCSLLNAGATLGHDVVIGDYANVGPGAHLAGRVTVGRNCIIGIGASIRENVTVGDGATVGAGSVVLKDVAPNTVVYGVPAQAR